MAIKEFLKFLDFKFWLIFSLSTIQISFPYKDFYIGLSLGLNLGLMLYWLITAFIDFLNLQEEKLEKLKKEFRRNGYRGI